VLTVCRLAEVLQWTPAEVVKWLERSAYSQETVEAVAQAGIAGKLLLRLSGPDLVTLGVIKLGDRKKLAKAIDEISATCVWSWVDQGTTIPLRLAPAHDTRTRMHAPHE
jgi:hypothetical protein